MTGPGLSAGARLLARMRQTADNEGHERLTALLKKHTDVDDVYVAPPTPETTS